ncbi:MAG: phosphomannomutase/phosphoglucomutase [Proteobacteria bacterium]|nr:phosphomannomutase/phosphoglucomutase [Pseudomonadota bacterium]
MNKKIFREYDIRGVAGTDLTEENVILVGKAVGTFLKRQGRYSLAVGRDCRLSSDLFGEKVIQGLLSTGCDVVDIGVCPTPVLYFSIQHFKREGGLMVTASHNPPEYNGFKLCSGVDSIHGEEIQQIYRMIETKDFETGQGRLTSADPLSPYTKYLYETIRISKPLRVGVDSGNGTAGPVALPVLKHFGCEVHDLYCDMDGRFPNHEADPTVAANMRELIALVKEKKLDVGIGYDGDGDRIGVVDETGKIVYGDQLMIVFAREILSRKPGATFISEVKCSKTMYDDIRKHGGNAVMWKTGHSLIKKKMKEEKAELAGEMSGHIFFSDRFLGFDDALYATLRLLEILVNTGKTMSDLLNDIPLTYNTPEIRVDCPDEIKFKVVDEITEYFRDGHDIIDIDGVRVLFDDGWGLVRASNTQPALVLRFEAMSRERRDEIQAYVENILDGIIAAI